MHQDQHFTHDTQSLPIINPTCTARFPQIFCGEALPQPTNVKVPGMKAARVLASRMYFLTEG